MSYTFRENDDFDQKYFLDNQAPKTIKKTKLIITLYQHQPGTTFLVCSLESLVSLESDSFLKFSMATDLMESIIFQSKVNALFSILTFNESDPLVMVCSKSFAFPMESHISLITQFTCIGFDLIVSTLRYTESTDFSTWTLDDLSVVLQPIANNETMAKIIMINIRFMMFSFF